MSSNFPTSQPGAKTNFDSNTTVASSLQNSQGEDINAVAAKVGSGAANNVPASGKLLRGTGAGTSQWDKDAPTGTIVGTSDTQTLTNKTLTAPTLTTPKADVINEETGDAGVTVDGLLIKDGNAAKATVMSTTAKAMAYLSTEQSVTTSSALIIKLDTTLYDSGSNFDTTNHYFVAPVDGFYLCIGSVTSHSGDAGDRFVVNITVNGTDKLKSEIEVIANDDKHGLQVSGIIQLSANDQVTLVKYGLNTAATIRGAVAETYLCIHLLST